MKKELKTHIEELIEALLIELGGGSEREDVTECVLVDVVEGYINDKYLLEDVIETSKYLKIPLDFERVVIRKIQRKKRKEQRAKTQKGKTKNEYQKNDWQTNY